LHKVGAGSWLAKASLWSSLPKPSETYTESLPVLPLALCLPRVLEKSLHFNVWDTMGTKPVIITALISGLGA
jgi:hypothetical protein